MLLWLPQMTGQLQKELLYNLRIFLDFQFSVFQNEKLLKKIHLHFVIDKENKLVRSPEYAR
jgi:hypothetical protein